MQAQADLSTGNMGHFVGFAVLWLIFEPPHDKTNKITCVPSEDLDQPGRRPSRIRVFTVHMRKHWALNYLLCAQWRLIRLGRCPGWSESSLGAHAILLVLSCCGSYFLQLKSFRCAGWLKIMTAVCKLTWQMSRIKIKPTIWPVHPAKTQISLGIWLVFAVHLMDS